MRKKIVLISVGIAAIILATYLYDLYTLKPHWVYICSPGTEGRTLTIF